MASGSTNDLVKDGRHLAAWVILASVVVGVIVLGLLDNKKQQNQG